MLVAPPPHQADAHADPGRLDNKHGSVPNCINPDSRGRLPVAIPSIGYEPAPVNTDAVRLDLLEPVRVASNKDVGGSPNPDPVFFFRAPHL